jgi:hypothetical protein
MWLFVKMRIEGKFKWLWDLSWLSCRRKKKKSKPERLSYRIYNPHVFVFPSILLLFAHSIQIKHDIKCPLWNIDLSSWFSTNNSEVKLKVFLLASIVLPIQYFVTIFLRFFCASKRFACLSSHWAWRCK